MTHERSGGNQKRHAFGVRLTAWLTVRVAGMATQPTLSKVVSMIGLPRTHPKGKVLERS